MEKRKRGLSISIIMFITLIVMVFFGVSYAAFTFNRTGGTSKLIAGDIYMHYKENNQLVLSDTMPMDIDKYVGYQVNPIMKEQEVGDNELTRCVNFLKEVGTENMDINPGETVEGFCRGSGTLWGINFQEGLNNGDFFPNEFITYFSDNDIIFLDENDNYIVNPVMATQEVQKVNQLTRCVDILNEWGWGFDEGSDAESFCKGTGTFDGGITFQEELEVWILWAKSDSTIEEGFLNDGGQELLDAGVIIPKIIEYKKYSINEEMTEEELNKCVTIFQDELGWGKNDDETWESFCQGTGTSYGDSFLDYLNNNWFYAYQLNYLEQNNIIVVEKEDKLPYFEFTISGKNTYTKKDIFYEIMLTHGDEHETRTTRIRDDLLRFSLVEIKDGNEILVVNNEMYSDLTNKRIFKNIISKNTNEEVEVTYRLYMWIDENTVIGNIEEDYTLEEWNDVFASIKVNVNGEVKGGSGENFVEVVKSKLGTDGLVAINKNGTLYNGTGAIREYRYSGPVANNYVVFNDDGDDQIEDDELWRIVGVFKDESGLEKIKIMLNTIIPAPNICEFNVNGIDYMICSYGSDVYYYGRGLFSSDWTTAGLQYYLNRDFGYLGTISQDYQDLISNELYYLGNVERYSTARNTYYAERNRSNIYPENKPIWRGLIGMLYQSDYGYSLDSSYWDLEMDSYNYGDDPRPYTTSWMELSANPMGEYFLNPTSVQEETVAGWWGGGFVEQDFTYGHYWGVSARPALYLESYVTIIDGTGTDTDPYILSLD